MSREARIQRTERIVKRRRKILEKYGGEKNLLWNKVRKHNLSCQCAICKSHKEYLRKERRERELKRTLRDD